MFRIKKDNSKRRYDLAAFMQSGSAVVQQSGSATAFLEDTGIPVYWSAFHCLIAGDKRLSVFDKAANHPGYGIKLECEA